MTDRPDPQPAQAPSSSAGDAQSAAEVGEAEGTQDRHASPDPAARPDRAPAGTTRAPGPGAPPEGRPGWATGAVSFPALLGSLIVAFGATFGLASLGGWGGLAGCALIIAAMISLVVAWAE